MACYTFSPKQQGVRWRCVACLYDFGKFLKAAGEHTWFRVHAWYTAGLSMRMEVRAVGSADAREGSLVIVRQG